MAYCITPEEAKAAITAHGTQARAAAALGVSVTTVERAIARGKTVKPFAFPYLRDDGRDIDSLLADRRAEFERRKDSACDSSLVRVQVNIDGPYAIAHMGDPHVDDPGADIALLERHTELVNKTPGMFAANVGDMNNNWVGRLARLFATQTTTGREAWQLVQWLVKRCDWLYMVGGNHDAWSGERDLLYWMAAQVGAHMRYHGVRLELVSQCGRAVRVNARHDFKGWSQWNEAHGPAKAVRMGTADHIMVCGHRHTSGYQIVYDPQDDIVCHCIRLESYKVFDDHADALNLAANRISPCAVTVIDPKANTPTGLVTTLWDIEAGADYLRFLRKRKR